LRVIGKTDPHGSRSVGGNTLVEERRR
jgi:hypothetical protein